MNQKFRYFTTFFALLTFFVLGNYISYRTAVSEFSIVEEQLETRISAQEEQASSLKKQYDNLSEQIEEQKEVSVSTQGEVLDIQTIFQIENYDQLNNRTSIEYETLPENLLGCSKEDADTYCKEYMEHLPVEEYLLGLKSMGVVSYSKERLVIKKIYDSSQVEYRYYLIAIDGEVVVYYGDKKTVYEYTGIETKNLTTKEQKALKNGIEVKDENELFGILENYSS